VFDLVSLDNDLDLDGLKHLLREVSYVQEGTPLNTQLANFKKCRKEVSVVVDEYGHTLGMLDVHDIIEEVVGYYAHRCAVPIGAVRFDGKSGYFVRADVSIRDLNRYLHWTLPEDRGTTVAGLVLQCIGGIPEGGCSVMIGEYVIEVVDMRKNRLILTYIKVGYI
jgi:Mg2+/Co2+ transporter CorB